MRAPAHGPRRGMLRYRLVHARELLLQLRERILVPQLRAYVDEHEPQRGGQGNCDEDAEEAKERTAAQQREDDDGGTEPDDPADGGRDDERGLRVPQDPVHNRYYG